MCRDHALGLEPSDHATKARWACGWRLVLGLIDEKKEGVRGGRCDLKRQGEHRKLLYAAALPREVLKLIAVSDREFELPQHVSVGYVPESNRESLIRNSGQDGCKLLAGRPPVAVGSAPPPRGRHLLRASPPQRSPRPR